MDYKLTKEELAYFKASSAKSGVAETVDDPSAIALFRYTNTGSPAPLVLTQEETGSLILLIGALGDPKVRVAKFRKRAAAEWMMRLYDSLEPWREQQALAGRLQRIRMAGEPRDDGGGDS